MTAHDSKLSSAVAERIIELLEEGSTDHQEWARQLNHLAGSHGRDVYVVLIFVLTHLDFAPEEAEEHWEAHPDPVGRDQPPALSPRGSAGGGPALLHIKTQRKLRNPAIVEMKILRRTQDSVITDELTGLYNYRYFQDRAPGEVRRAERESSTLTLLMVDVDDFKVFNDTRGHLAGNVALRHMASVLKQSVRDTDVVARYGGEEFAILLPNTPKLGALKVAEKIRRAVKKAGVGRDDEAGHKSLTISIGLASTPGDAGSLDELVDRADRALYVAKSVGKDCVRPFSDERREFSRVDATLPGHLSLVESKGHAFETVNVSEAGLLLMGTTPVDAGELARVRIQVPSVGHPVEAVVRVVRCQERKKRYEIAARIEHMSTLHQRRYNVFLRDLKAGNVVAIGEKRRPRAIRPKRPQETRKARTA